MRLSGQSETRITHQSNGMKQRPKRSSKHPQENILKKTTNMKANHVAIKANVNPTGNHKGKKKNTKGFKNSES